MNPYVLDASVIVNRQNPIIVQPTQPERSVAEFGALMPRIPAMLRLLVR